MGYHVAVVCVVVGWGYLARESEICYNIGWRCSVIYLLAIICAAIVYALLVFLASIVAAIRRTIAWRQLWHQLERHMRPRHYLLKQYDQPLRIEQALRTLRHTKGCKMNKQQFPFRVIQIDAGEDSAPEEIARLARIALRSGDYSEAKTADEALAIALALQDS